MTAQPSASPSGVVTRLVQSLSGSKTTGGSKPSISPGNSETVQQQSESSTAAWRRKLSAIDRFKNFGKNRKEKKTEFPPPTWFDEGEGNNDPSTTAAAADFPLPRTPEVESRLDDLIPHNAVVIPPPSADQMAVESGEERSGPGYIVQTIQTFMSSFPTSARSTPSDPPSTSQTDAEGRPIPPPPPVPIHDSNLVSLLSSASVMNGSIGRGTQSIWSLLEKLRAPKHLLQGGGEEHAEQEGEVEGDGGGDAGEGREKWDRSDDEDSSVMVHSPLIPGADSKVLLADSDMVPVLEEVETDPHSDNPQSGPSQLGGEPLPKKPSQGLWTQLKTWRVKTHRVWTPSPTNISLQATWWGFRIYLPPPVLDVLNSKQLEAAKRAAMITTALKWLLDHIPVKLVPPQFRPVVPMLKQLTPYLGYIGIFIAWSWSAIKMYDKGHGVVLSATWLLPVALIPSAWDCDLPPVTIHRDKTPTGEDNVEPSRSGKREDASAEGKSNATTRCSHSWKGKEKARE